MADTFQIGDWFVEPELNSLSTNGSTVRVEPKIMQVLVCLAKHANELVSKDRLIQTVWTNTFVSDDVLTRSISELRRCFGDDPKEPRFIETIPKSGYRLIAPVSFVSAKQESHSPEVSEDAATPTDKRRSEWLSARVVVTCLFVAALAAVAVYVWNLTRPGASARSNSLKSIVVLPFKSVGPEVGDEYLGVEIADTLTTRLSGTKQLVVCPPGPARKYSDKNQDPLAAGRELSMDLVLDGSIQRADDRVRMTVRLLRVADGSAVFAEQYDEKFADILALQDSVTEKVARSLALNLTGEERKLLTKRYTDNTEAYRLYVLGRYFENKGTEEGYKNGIEYFNEALRIEPSYALAYSGLADTYNQATQNFILSPKEGYLKAKEAALRALEIDPSLAEAYHSLACVKWIFEYDWEGTELNYKRGLDLDPAYMPNRLCYAEYLAGLGRHDESFAVMSRYPEPGPTEVFRNLAFGELFYWSRQYDRAIQQLQNALELEPEVPATHFLLGLTYEQKEMYENALAELQKSNSLIHSHRRQQLSARFPDRKPLSTYTSSMNVTAALGHAYAVSGHKTKAKELIQQLEKQAKRSYVSPYNIALIYTGLGESEKVFEWLEKEYADRSGGFTRIKVDPRFDPLRADSRFENLLERAGIPQ